MNIKVFHTKNGIFVGNHLPNETQTVNGRVCEAVQKLVMISFADSQISLSPIFTLTKEDVYFIPRDELIFAKPMEAMDNLRAAYVSKYGDPPPLPKPERIPDLELTTFPKE